MPPNTEGGSVEFKDLIFGTGAAEDEAVEYPELLLDGYFDPQDMPKRLLDGPNFLVLGPKGSGKSALCEHLRLQAETNPELFVTRIELNNIHFDQFSSMVPDNGNKNYYLSTWEWLLVLNLFTSFAQDQGAHSNSNEDYLRTIQALRAAGFLPQPRLDIGQLLSFTSEGDRR